MSGERTAGTVTGLLHRGNTALGGTMEQNWKVLIVGHNNVLNQLVAMAIREELRLACEIHPDIDPGAVDAPDTSDRTALLLVDDCDQKARSGL